VAVRASHAESRMRALNIIYFYLAVTNETEILLLASSPRLPEQGEKESDS